MVSHIDNESDEGGDGQASHNHSDAEQHGALHGADTLHWDSLGTAAGLPGSMPTACPVENVDAWHSNQDGPIRIARAFLAKSVAGTLLEMARW